MAIWNFLQNTLGFMGATTFLYVGLIILVPLTIYFCLKSCINFYKNY